MKINKQNHKFVSHKNFQERFTTVKSFKKDLYVFFQYYNIDATSCFLVANLIFKNSQYLTD